ncbi:hypothetical protein ILUMI_10065 [Ignelater luminosus]|uniref:Uncharacterized protein n=1 Tax=Ignelater luminosus TaxID=2038154 RepID=A0A8K0D2Z8_IGNLU|nr:hypothetical protein ILUMI_10065 [Ignelater luminosus]
MESQRISDEFPLPTKSLEEIVKSKITQQDGQMTSSIASATSSLTSPVDSGVQLLDSECEITSLMSMSGIGSDFDTTANVDNEEINRENSKNSEPLKVCSPKPSSDKEISPQEDIINDIEGDSINEERHIRDNKINYELLKSANNIAANKTYNNKEEVQEVKQFNKDSSSSNSRAIIESQIRPKLHIMTKSDIDNHNTSQFDLSTSPAVLNVGLSSNSTNSTMSLANIQSDKVNKKYDQSTKLLEVQKRLSDDVFELEPILISDNVLETKKTDNTDDLMNVSLNSYELLDYTVQNSKPTQDDGTATVADDMHVSMSEEVNESLKISTTEINEPPSVGEPEKQMQTSTDDQIVFRRQRRKKSKSDTPKKRVSFHEDILNSTKIDDIHINHGFITHEQDISMSFFERGFTRKPDVVKGRYSWAAEGDTPYYQKSVPEREVKSDIYIHRARFSSTSSSSSASISSSIDEEDTGNSNSDDAYIKKEPTQKLPKSSCLKKTKTNKKYIDTNIVQEETNLKKKKSETNLLDSNIFGSLKNIFSFSTSVPLAERGVPEGQEDITVYSTSDTGIQKQRKYSGSEFSIPKNFDGYEVQPAPVKKIGNLNLELAKTNLKLTKSEGFYPNYPNNQNLPNNIVLCDSNVYEHKGISYSYEYEKFQKTFEQQNKTKSSTVYQMLLNELNFFKKKEKKALEKEAKENFEVLNASTPIKDTKLDESLDEKKSYRKY